MQIGADPVHEASCQVLWGIDEVWPSAERERSNLGSHHVQLVLRRGKRQSHGDIIRVESHHDGKAVEGSDGTIGMCVQSLRY